MADPWVEKSPDAGAWSSASAPVVILDILGLSTYGSSLLYGAKKELYGHTVTATELGDPTADWEETVAGDDIWQEAVKV